MKGYLPRKALKSGGVYFLPLLLPVFLSSSGFAGELSGNISLEGRYFNHQGAFADQQKNGGLSLSLLPEYKHQWDNDHKKFTFTPFFRWDQHDKERTHGDIRQLDYLASKGDWEYQVGISKVYWGVTESQHLVDIINQTDGVEGIDGEDKLGQPMVRLSRITDNGSLDLFVLPYFRERTFAGKKGRFRAPFIVDNNATTYESSRKEKHVDYAVRFQETVGDADIGVHYFTGTSRDPVLNPIINNSIPVGLQAHYPLITQVGIDLQYTGEDTIWKLEAISRNFEDKKLDDYSAVVAGFEHSLPGFESGAELSLLAEYHHDSRGEVPQAAFQNDLFVGARFALNDEASTDLLAGAFIDLDNNTQSMRLEASRRIGKGLKLNLEGQVFTNVDDKDPLNAFQKDDYIQVELQKYF